MTGKIVKILVPIFGSAAVMLFSGCAVENQFFAKLPFFEAKSDHIPGLDPPPLRKKLIREKGKMGAKASEADKEVYVAQLVYEYQTSPDPNMRREAVDALAMIPYPDRDRYLQEIVKDESPFVRLSALEALSKTYSGNPEDLTALLIDRMKADTDKDVRLVSIRILGDVCSNPHVVRDPLGRKQTVHNDPSGGGNSAIVELGNLLHDKVPAIRYAAMGSLQKITGKDYGHDINRWLQYVRYTNGEVPNSPPERSLAEKMPSIALPMLK
ncbi:MAG: HEAT repeat domain-containing protein [Planctomycetaceae bacterium]|nr:HEAT repeat domain-containing protein [Planctomycetaceae bacterium]